MHNPENFRNPENFDPERFLDENGRFQTDVRVCPFSVGLRNCIGKQLANEQYFMFAAEIIRTFKIEKNSGNFKPAPGYATLQAKPMKLRFIPRD